MIQNFAKLIVGSFLMPRRTIRVVLAQRFGAEEIALLVLFGYLVSEILSIIVPDARPEGGTDLNRYVVGVIGSALSFLAFAWPVYGLGRVFGGTADFQQSCTVVAWYSIIDKFVFVPLTAKVEKLLAAVKAGPMTEETALAIIEVLETLPGLPGSSWPAGCSCSGCWRVSLPNFTALSVSLRWQRQQLV